MKAFFVLLILALPLRSDARELAAPAMRSPDPRFILGELLASDDFSRGLDLWQWELEKGGSVTARDGALEIDVPGGCTVWLKAPLSGATLISYEATMISAGGPNDRVSDLNCFWMARDARNPDDLFAVARSGKFSDYDQLRCYYVGHGGNTNTTTRFRRYIGEKGNRPIRPEHDLTAKEFLLVPNATQTIQLIAAGPVIGYYRDGRQLFACDDPAPYTGGWFAFRTTASHLKVKNFRVHRLLPGTKPPADR
ncbi:MAG TPA: DUF6250 domain-containing protein [Opitutaceae bacterium]|nr:DUF6250 domain-containing protein [Opitutaceae bacterium]